MKSLKIRSNKLGLICIQLILLSSLLNARETKCDWQDSRGNSFDFSPLHKKGGYKIRDSLSTENNMFDLLYITNVCETVTCESSEVSVYEGLEILGEITSNCDILTPAVPPEYKYINEAVPLLGVQFTYKGDICELPPTLEYSDDGKIITKPNLSKEQRTTTFIVTCEDHQQDNFIVDATDPCHIRFSISSPTGCFWVKGSHSMMFKIFIGILVIFVLYFGIGVFLNNRIHGHTGVEALPHHEFWIQFPSYVVEGIKFTFQKLSQLIRKFISQTEQQPSMQRAGKYSFI